MKMRFGFIVLLSISLICISRSQAAVKVIPVEFLSCKITTSQSGDSILLNIDSAKVLKQSPAADHKNKKLISAILAFPFPFGFMGAHRVMLGCKPWIPVFYVATFGGCFGLLPMIDFCAIVFSKDIEQYENNPHIFMWVK
jgi:TM2 domain-containing membrane protein YozV